MKPSVYFVLLLIMVCLVLVLLARLVSSYSYSHFFFCGLNFMDLLACTLPDCTSEQNLDKHEPWWENFTVKLKLSQIYKDRKSWDCFVDTIYPSVRKSFLEAIQQKVIYASIITLNIIWVFVAKLQLFFEMAEWNKHFALCTESY